MATSRTILVNQSGFSTANGDITYIGKDATIDGSIDMRGNGGGDQWVTVYGSMTGGFNDYYGTNSGNNQFLIGATGSVDGQFQLAGGGNNIVNLGTIASMSSNAIYVVSVYYGAHTSERTTITNGGTISGMSANSSGTYSDATIYMYDGDLTLTNTGVILSSSGWAMRLGNSNIVRNTGYIGGISLLGGGDDLFDSRGGTLWGEVRASWGNDTVFGGVTDDTLIGDVGDDKLDGSLGNDILIGGIGNDVYTVDSTEDIVDENNATYFGGGADVINSWVSFDLSDTTHVIGAIETLRLLGSTDLNATGAARSETIAGNLGNNLIRGEAGNDRLNGNAGDDRLVGATGADQLNGGRGEDRLYGGADNDLLNGGTGGDTMFGGAGNDTYFVDDIDDIVSEAPTGSSGSDLVNSTIGFDLSDIDHVKGVVENLTLLGTGSITGLGNTLANVIVGNSGANTIDGGRGNDTLTGGAGADRFRFSTALVANLDTINAFVHSSDKIVLDHAIFTQLAAGLLSAANFAINAPGDSNDFIIYNTTTGVLTYDANGSGAGGGLAFAKLSGVPGITQGDFVIS